MASRIEQIIDEIEEYIDNCKFQPLSTTKIVVNKEEIEELLRELRLKTPEEIKRYQKIISNKDAILEVMQQAYTQANETISKSNQQAQSIIDSATQDANNIRISAITYTDEMLANLEELMGNTLHETNEKHAALMNSLQEAYNTVRQNRQELSSQGGTASEDYTDTSYEDYEEDEYELPEDDDM